MHRTVDDYDSMAKREIIKAKQEKAQMYVFFPLLSALQYFRPTVILRITYRRVQKFRTDYSELRTQFETLKKEADAQVSFPLNPPFPPQPTITHPNTFHYPREQISNAQIFFRLLLQSH